MRALEQAIGKAITSKGQIPDANRAYLEFIKANFIIPVEKKSASDAPSVLYLEDNDRVFLPVFTNRTDFDHWASDIKDNIALLNLSGVDLLKGIGEFVFVSLNIGGNTYKEFNPSELARMRSMILKLGIGRPT